MRAIPGTASMTVVELPDPEPGPGEVIVDVVAAGVNRADLLQRAGHYPPPAGASDVFGLEVSGTICAVGDGVTGWRIGDEVCALLAGGGYAEKVAVPWEQVMPVPRGIDPVAAAGLPEVACTVMSNVVMTGCLAPGEMFLVHGGSSGIGTHAIQLAHAMGARVATTARNADKLARAADLGADILIDYRTDDFVEILAAEGGADVILDIIGAKYLAQNLSALATNGRLVIIGMQGGAKAELNIGALMAKRASVSGTTLRSRPTTGGPDSKFAIVTETVARTWPLIESGDIAPVIDSTFPLADAAAAHARLESGDAVGKVLLTV
ncbi:NAD(P)H-quinone oxidoreductase [Gordonia neofelifaecis]|uniref:NAD(P)H quinone oxidoreductase, PIG3 family protein n=1 Tax=Gordonia neofelifaecis NRRL B-59395 TaxID=644548 RepID=F1YPA3_9ACTN|nr:NAD(P)H-quinone oxidoreductase [Gordonia neofelifaecis]EGD53498.1 NAD(P)H quinone oxidoreductase, PIG3 family protein [Gordonia neofelifaecis NRRL B-59395]